MLKIKKKKQKKEKKKKKNINDYSRFTVQDSSLPSRESKTPIHAH